MVHSLAVTLKAKVPGLDDAGMHRADGNFVDLVAVHREELCHRRQDGRAGFASPGVVAGALRRLSPKLQVIAVLALVEELPHAEIAAALDVPLGTVKSRLFRAVRALRRELGSLGIQP